MIGSIGAVLVVASACSGSRDALYPRPREAALAVQCGEGSGNEVRLEHGVDPGAPVIVLQEIHLHGQQPPQPTVAIWRDGRVLFDRRTGVDADGNATFELLEGSIPKSAVETLVREVGPEVASAPRYTKAEQGYISDGGQLTTITVRSDDRWLSASVYGAYEDDFLETAAGTRTHGVKKSEPLDPNTPESKIDTSRFLPGLGEPPLPPPSFSRAYRRLLTSRPDHGVAFVPYDFDLTFLLLSPHEQRTHPSEMTWPRELPPPPPAKDLVTCDPYDTACPHMLDKKYRDGALRLVSTIRANKVIPYLVIDGQCFVVRVDGLYQGQRDIDALRFCASQLRKRDKR